MDAENGTPQGESAAGVTPKRPSLGKMYFVALGREEWTPEERAWLDADPERHERHEEFCAAIRQNADESKSQRPGFVEREAEKSRENKPPSKS